MLIYFVALPFSALHDTLCAIDYVWWWWYLWSLLSALFFGSPW